MNRYRLICQYCNHTWEWDYIPNHSLSCTYCNDKNVRVIDNKVNKVDYYAGSPPFPEKKDIPKTIDLEPEESIKDPEPLTGPGHWDTWGF